MSSQHPSTSQRLVVHPNILRQLQELQRAMGNQQAVSQSVIVAGAQVNPVTTACTLSTRGSTPVPSSSQGPTPVPSPAGGLNPITYNYKVRIINQNKKSDVKVRMIHQKKFKFKSVDELREHLATEIEDLIANNESFDVCFMEGSQQAKVWLENSDDLDRMYKLYPKGGNITFCQCSGYFRCFPKS